MLGCLSVTDYLLNSFLLHTRIAIVLYTYQVCYTHFHMCRFSREESFTALNIDIRNQQHLFESLDAFVKGDLLEGANAYHCEKCDKKVCMLLPDTYSIACIELKHEYRVRVLVVTSHGVNPRKITRECLSTRVLTLDGLLARALTILT